MAAGDAHRVWFPEMVEHLRLRWRDDMSMEALLWLRDELDDMLGRILAIVASWWVTHRDAFTYTPATADCSGSICSSW